MSSTRQKILVVDDQEMMRTILIRFLQRAGYEVICAENGLKAIQLYRLHNPILVISDIKMPQLNGLELLAEIKKIDEHAMVILITGFGNEEILLKALRGGAINFFKKPIEIEEIIAVVKQAIRHRLATNYPEFYTTSFQEETKHFMFSPASLSLTPLINQLTINLPCFFSASEIINLKIGIEEMINNAVEHGCLGIGFFQKNQAVRDGRFSSLLAERISQTAEKPKHVYVTSQLNHKEYRVIIRDEGDGFNWAELPSLAQENLLQYNGRGILLTRIFFDEVTYNEKGNEVTLRKFISAKDSGSSLPHPQSSQAQPHKPGRQPRPTKP